MRRAHQCGVVLALIGIGKAHAGDTPTPLSRDATFEAQAKIAVTTYAVEIYCEVHGRFAWAIRPDLELVVTGQNLLQSRHDEFGPQTVEPRYELQRGVFAKLSRRF